MLGDWPINGTAGPAQGYAASVGEDSSHHIEMDASSLLAAIVGSSHDAIIGQDLRGEILTWNSGAQRLYGWSASEAVGRHISILVPSDRRDSESRLFDATIAGELIAATEVRHLHRDGHQLTVSLSMSPILGHAGRIVGVASLSRDIGEIRRSQAQLAAIVMSSHDAVIGKSLDGRILSWNAGAERLYGWSALEALGRPIELLVPPDQRALESQLFAKTLSGDRLEAVVVQRSHRNGSLIEVSLSMSPIRDDAGVIVGIASSSRDAGERRRSERIFELILDAAPDGTVCTGADGLITFVNAEVVRIFQYPSSELLGLPLTTLLDSRGWDPSYGTFPSTGAPRRGATGGHQMMGRRKDGSLLPVDVGFASVSGPNGQLTITSIRDVTEREVAAVALRSAQAAAQSASAAKTEFLSRMSHELRTPLTAILGYGQLLQLEHLGGSQGEAVTHILRGGRHLLAIINDVMDISAIENNQVDLFIESIEISKFLSDSLGLMKTIADSRSITMNLCLLPNNGAVRADRRRLEQILLNLLSNAIKFTPPGGRVTVTSRPVGSDRMAIVVTDTGPGIRPADLNRLFTPFDRLDLQSSDIEGAGIGLALSQRLAILMDGRIEVSSILGSSSTFTIILPLGSPSLFGETIDDP